MTSTVNKGAGVTAPTMSDDEKPLTRGDFKELMTAHEATENSARAVDMQRFLSAFPAGDPIKHCEYHMAKIKAAEAEQRFWELAQGKAIERGIEGLFGALKVVVTLALTAVAFKLGLKLPFFGD